MELREVVNIKTGKQVNRIELSNKYEYPAYNGGIQNSGFYNKWNYENKIIISQGGENAGFVNFIDQKFWANAHCYVINLNSNQVINKYLYYFLKNNEKKIKSYKNGAGIPGLNINDLRKIKIAIPSLEEQKIIVEILDKFSELTTELTTELTIEQILRVKQYNFYRDNILNFKK